MSNNSLSYDEKAGAFTLFLIAATLFYYLERADWFSGGFGPKGYALRQQCLADEEELISTTNGGLMIKDVSWPRKDIANKSIVVVMTIQATRINGPEFYIVCRPYNSDRKVHSKEDIKIEYLEYFDRKHFDEDFPLSLL